MNIFVSFWIWNLLLCILVKKSGTEFDLKGQNGNYFNLMYMFLHYAMTDFEFYSIKVTKTK